MLEPDHIQAVPQAREEHLYLIVRFTALGFGLLESGTPSYATVLSV
jgi:hypothetical protein